MKAKLHPLILAAMEEDEPGSSTVVAVVANNVTYEEMWKRQWSGRATGVAVEPIVKKFYRSLWEKYGSFKDSTKAGRPIMAWATARFFSCVFTQEGKIDIKEARGMVLYRMQLLDAFGFYLAALKVVCKDNVVRQAAESFNQLDEEFATCMWSVMFESLSEGAYDSLFEVFAKGMEEFSQYSHRSLCFLPDKVGQRTDGRGIADHAYNTLSVSTKVGEIEEITVGKKIRLFKDVETFEFKDYMKLILRNPTATQLEVMKDIVLLDVPEPVTKAVHWRSSWQFSTGVSDFLSHAELAVEILGVFPEVFGIQAVTLKIRDKKIVKNFSVFPSLEEKARVVAMCASSEDCLRFGIGVDKEGKLSFPGSMLHEFPIVYYSDLRSVIPLLTRDVALFTTARHTRVPSLKVLALRVLAADTGIPAVALEQVSVGVPIVGGTRQIHSLTIAKVQDRSKNAKRRRILNRRIRELASQLFGGSFWCLWTREGRSQFLELVHRNDRLQGFVKRKVNPGCFGFTEYLRNIFASANHPISCYGSVKDGNRQGLEGLHDWVGEFLCGRKCTHQITFGTMEKLPDIIRFQDQFQGAPLFNVFPLDLPDLIPDHELDERIRDDLIARWVDRDWEDNERVPEDDDAAAEGDFEAGLLAQDNAPFLLWARGLLGAHLDLVDWNLVEGNHSMILTEHPTVMTEDMEGDQAIAYLANHFREMFDFYQMVREGRANVDGVKQFIRCIHAILPIRTLVLVFFQLGFDVVHYGDDVSVGFNPDFYLD